MINAKLTSTMEKRVFAWCLRFKGKFSWEKRVANLAGVEDAQKKIKRLNLNVPIISSLSKF